MISLLQIEGLSKSFGDLVLFRNITFGIAQGQKIGLIAKNGSGKTTLLNIIAGKEGYDSGSVVFRNDLRIGYLEQSPHFREELTVLEACLYALSTNPLIEKKEVKYMPNHISDLQTHHNMSPLDGDRIAHEQRAKEMLTRLKISDFDKPVGTLSGGQLKRVALGNVLVTEPELILLDEPTNHLDLEMIEWLEGYLDRSTISILMVTHDRYFLDRICNDIVEIDQKELFRYQGNYSYYLEKRSERLAAKNTEIERAGNLMRKELDWMRRQPQARATKAKYRIHAFYELEEKSMQRMDNRQVRLNVSASYIGSKIFEAVDICKSFDETRILQNFNYTFSRYEKLGIVGNNGTGKSTFIKMLTGEIEPDSGHFDIGETVRFGVYSQEGLTFDDHMKVIDVVRNIAEYITMGDGKTMTVAQFLNYFLFTPVTQHDFVAKLSGGEKRRLYLCTVLMRNPNFLILDEPTNDLDIITLNILEEYLIHFKGCVIVVSHDRYFMDKIVDHILVFHGDADVCEFPGNYSHYRDWKEWKKKADKNNKAGKSEDTGKYGNSLNAKKNATPSKSNSNNTINPSKTSSRIKLSYKELREFESLEGEIASFENKKKELETALNSGNLSIDELTQKSNHIGELIRMIDEKTMRWLELSEMK
ncbi:MAG: ABC-F family ATP-binding cassette domain-containing protein [Tannerella sp.]|jgi:ATP-binding cassette subfamily F protein uup|nr:ABC-F family ATP-binding cassette domain-containing protein [Tannerella sp.]